MTDETLFSETLLAAEKEFEEAEFKYQKVRHRGEIAVERFVKFYCVQKSKVSRVDCGRKSIQKWNITKKHFRITFRRWGGDEYEVSIMTFPVEAFDVAVSGTDDELRLQVASIIEKERISIERQMKMKEEQLAAAAAEKAEQDEQRERTLLAALKAKYGE